MGKRKNPKFVVRHEFLLVLAIVIFAFGAVVLGKSQNAFGNYGNYDNEDKDKKEKGKSEDHNNKPSTETVSQEVPVVPTVVMTIAPVVAPVVQRTMVPAETPAYIPDSTTTTTTTSETSNEFQSAPPVFDQSETHTVPLSERSVINSQPIKQSAKPSSGSILESIKNSFGSFVSKKEETPTQAPTPKQEVKQLEPNNTEKKVTADQVVLNYQTIGGTLSLSAEDKNGNSVVVDDSRLREIESFALGRLEKKGISLELTSKNQLALIDNNVTTVTSLPIMVDISTNTLVVRNGNDLLPITYTPDRALKNIIDQGIIAKINTKVTPIIEISEGEVVYKFEATKVYKIFGKFSVTAPVTISVSASTGDIVNRDQPLITRAVSIISL